MLRNTEKKLISKRENEHELFNDDILHVLQNTLNLRTNSATDIEHTSQASQNESNGKAKLKQ